MANVEDETPDQRRTREQQEHNHREAMDDIDLLRRVERAGSAGYKLVDGDIRSLMSAYRLMSNAPPRRGIFREPLRSKSKDEPWTLVFAGGVAPSIARILERLKECEER